MTRFFANMEIRDTYAGTKFAIIQSMVAKRGLTNQANVRLKHSLAEFKKKATRAEAKNRILFCVMEENQCRKSVSKSGGGGDIEICWHFF